MRLVRDSILMGDVKIGEGARISRAIIDKHVRIPPGVVIGEEQAGISISQVSPPQRRRRRGPLHRNPPPGQIPSDS